VHHHRTIDDALALELGDDSGHVGARRDEQDLSAESGPGSRIR
jgi:hypothetical protein